MNKFKDNIFVFDLDSTLVQDETLDSIIEVALSRLSGKLNNDDKIIKKIRVITKLGMEGKIDFKESLQKRIAVVHMLQKDIDFYNQNILPGKIDKIFRDVVRFIQDNKGEVFIVSGGFMSIAAVVADSLGINVNNVFANEFIMDKCTVIGFDEKNPLVASDGKVVIVKNIRNKYKNKKVICVGDGNGDYLIKKNGVADEFWGFWGNVRRGTLIKKADRNFYNSRELLKFLEG